MTRPVCKKRERSGGRRKGGGEAAAEEECIWKMYTLIYLHTIPFMMSPRLSVNTTSVKHRV
jgi:hypothetical protein